MSKFKINILFLTFLFYLISGFSFQAAAQNEWGNDEDWGNEKKKGLFKRKTKTDEFGQPLPYKKKVPFLKRIFKGKNDSITDPIANAKKNKNTSFQLIESEYFDGKNLNKKEQKKIAKQVRKYNKQKPSKWEQNYLEMRKRGYPVHPDTVRKYRGLAAKVQRRKDARTRKMNKVYKKNLYPIVLLPLKSYFKRKKIVKVKKDKSKKNLKKQKKKARQLKRRQRTGHYLPFYQRWFQSFTKKTKKKKIKKNRQKKDK